MIDLALPSDKSRDELLLSSCGKSAWAGEQHRGQDCRFYNVMPDRHMRLFLDFNRPTNRRWQFKISNRQNLSKFTFGKWANHSESECSEKSKSAVSDL